MRIILFLLLAVSTSANAFKNEPVGFRGLSWGDDILLYQEQMQLATEGKEIKIYTRNDDSMKIGGADIKMIGYVFRDDKFESVIITTEGVSNYSSIREAFESQFGRPEKPNRYIDEYWWKGKTATIFLDCNKIRYKCTATIFSTNSLNARKNKDKQDFQES